MIIWDPSSQPKVAACYKHRGHSSKVVIMSVPSCRKRVESSSAHDSIHCQGGRVCIGYMRLEDPLDSGTDYHTQNVLRVGYCKTIKSRISKSSTLPKRPQSKEKMVSSKRQGSALCHKRLSTPRALAAWRLRGLRKWQSLSTFDFHFTERRHVKNAMQPTAEPQAATSVSHTSAAVNTCGRNLR